MVFTCSFCPNIKFNVFTKYLTHLNLFHSQNNNFFLQCVVHECPNIFTNFHTFKSHVYRKHRNVFFPNKPDVHGDYICKTCNNCPQVSFKKLLDISKHLNTHTKQNETIFCPFTKCTAKFKNFSSYKSHLSRKHRYCTDTDEKKNSLYNCDEELIRDINFSKDPLINLESISVEEVDFDSKMKQHVGLLLLKTQEKHMLPLSTTQKILQDFNSLLEMQSDYLINKIKNEASNLNISNESFLKINDILRENCIFKSIDSLSNNYKRMKYYEAKMQLVLPVEYYLGNNSFNKSCCFQYVSILKTLNFLLMQNDVFAQVMNPKHNRDENIFINFDDGKFCKTHPLFSTNPHALKLNLFCDEFEICNPLGVHRKTHKLLAFYYILGNVYPEYSSSTDIIQLAILCKSIDMKNFGIDKIVEPLIKDLNILATDGVSARGETFVGSLSFISGDNLGSNMIGGFVESFSNKVNCYCRTCLCDKTEIQNTFSDEHITLRTPENYKQHVTELIEDNTKLIQFGIKNDSPFNSEFFHVTRGLPPDIAHDLLEGVVPYETSLVLTVLNTQKVISIDYINKNIQMWPYGPLDSINKPSTINKNCKINQTASRMWTLLRLLPLMCAAIIPENNLYWKLFLDIKDIVEIIFAPVLTIDHIAYLKIRIDDHLQLFKELFPDKTLIPKQHFLIHYPSHILNFGPLRLCWTLRFEAKHYYFKKLAAIGKNFKNITHTLANRHQLRQAYNGSNSGKYLQHYKSLGTVTPINLRSIQPEAAQVVVKNKKIVNLYSVSHFTMNSIKYVSGLFIVRKLSEEEPIFSKILHILTNSDKVFFLLEDYESYYNDHLGAYNIKKMSNENYFRFFLIDVSLLQFRYPFSSYYINGNWFIVLKHIMVALNDVPYIECST